MYRVIIVEDDPMVAAINRQYIDVTPSFRTDRIFKNGSEALSYLKKADADLIILDYYMPSMNGGEFLDALHAAGKAPAVIMVTSANDTDIVKSLLNRGVIDYLVKPFEYTRFRAALDKFSNTSEYLKNARTNLDQAAIDRLLTHPESSGESKPSLNKGLNEATLKLVRDFLKAHPDDFFTSEQLAEQIHLSRITIRRYMNYMVDTGELVSDIDYKTGGRPSIRYRYGKSALTNERSGNETSA